LGAVAALQKKGGIRENLIFYGQDNFEITCEGDSGGPTFSYLRNLSIVGLNGIHLASQEDFSESMPLDVILREGELELVRSQ
ncbi:11133_t:CDS:1, partial [Gigaspora margarita]